MLISAYSVIGLFDYAVVCEAVILVIAHRHDEMLMNLDANDLGSSDYDFSKGNVFGGGRYVATWVIVAKYHSTSIRQDSRLQHFTRMHLS